MAGTLCCAIATACGGVSKDVGKSRPSDLDAGAGGANNAGHVARGGGTNSAGTNPSIGRGGTNSGGRPGSGGLVTITDGGASSMGGTGGVDSWGGPETGPPLQCGVRDDHITTDLFPMPPPVDAGTIQTVDVTFDGVVRSVTEETLVLDTCLPNADCSNGDRRLIIAAPGLSLRMVIQEEALASVHFVRQCFYVCSTSIVISALETWGGLVNHRFPPNGQLYLAIDEGNILDSKPFYTWEPVRLDCDDPFKGTCGGDKSGVYAIRFRAGGEELVTMGEEGYVFDGRGLLRVHNVRSYETNDCDDYWNFAHWATSLGPPGD